MPVRVLQLGRNVEGNQLDMALRPAVEPSVDGRRNAPPDAPRSDWVPLRHSFPDQLPELAMQGDLIARQGRIPASENLTAIQGSLRGGTFDAPVVVCVRDGEHTLDWAEIGSLRQLVRWITSSCDEREDSVALVVVVDPRRGTAAAEPGVETDSRLGRRLQVALAPSISRRARFRGRWRARGAAIHPLTGGSRRRPVVAVVTSPRCTPTGLRSSKVCDVPVCVWLPEPCLRPSDLRVYLRALRKALRSHDDVPTAHRAALRAAGAMSVVGRTLISVRIGAP